ncbi:DUF1189 family protein [candidate division KSB1 bacterium]|nr:DUF1189 family protein [candidate division KSB1 bacterium]
MIKLFQQKRFSIFSILVSTVIVAVFISLSLMGRLQHFVDFYEPVLNETTPTIILDDGEITFEGNIPQRIELANGVEVFFAETVNDSLFQLSPVNSVFIAKKEIWHKRSDDIKKYSLEGVRMDDGPLRLQPLQVKEKLRGLRTTAFLILLVTSIVFLFLIFMVLAYFGAGVGIMIDAFQNGPHSFAELLNWSSIFLLICALLWIIFTSRTFHSIGYFFLLHIGIMIAFVYLRLFSARQHHGKMGGA